MDSIVAGIPLPHPFTPRHGAPGVVTVFRVVMRQGERGPGLKGDVAVGPSQQVRPLVGALSAWFRHLGFEVVAVFESAPEAVDRAIGPATVCLQALQRAIVRDGGMPPLILH